VGLQYDYNENITLGFAYELLVGGQGRVDKKGGPLLGDIKGKYNTNFVHVVNLNIVRKF
jgi:long-chain fatty acid transport protein